MNKSVILAAAAVTLWSGAAASAATLYWDGNGSTAGAGNTTALLNKTWGIESMWNDDALGGAGTFTVATTSGDDLYFVAGPSSSSGAIASQVVTVDGTQAANSLNFQRSGSLTISGGTAINLDAGINVTQYAYGTTANGAVTISTPIALQASQTFTNNSTNTLAVSGIVSDGGNAYSLTKSGTGTLTLSGANSYTGSTTIVAGVLALGASVPNGGAGVTSPLGNSTSAVLLGNTTGTANALLRTTGAFTVARNIIVQSGNTGTATVGTGTAFTTTSTYSGTLTLGTASSTGRSVSLTTGDGILHYSGAIQDPAGLVGAGGTVTTSTGQYGAVILSGDNSSMSGGVTLSAGTLSLKHAKALGTGTLTIKGGALTGTVSPTTNNQIVLDGNLGLSNAQGGGSLDLGTGNVSLTGNRAITVNINTLTLGGVIDDAGNGFGITYTGGGAPANNYTNSLALNGASTFSGGVTVGNVGTAGRLSIGNLGTTTAASAIGTGRLTLNAGARFDNGSAAAGTLSTNNAQTWNASFTFVGTRSLGMGDGAVTLGASVTATVAANALTIGGGIGDGGNAFGLTKAGAGTMVLAGANTYTGNTTVSGGILTLDTTGSILLDINDGSSNQIAGSGTVNLNGKLVLDVSDVTAANTWTLVAASTLAETYGGTFGLTLAGSNTAFSPIGGGLWAASYGGSTWTFDSGNGELNVVIPEPASVVMTGLMAATILGGRRRRVV